MATTNPDRLTRDAELKNIRLRGAEIGTSVQSPAESGPVAILFDKEISSDLPKGSDELIIRIDFSVSIVSDMPETSDGGEDSNNFPDPIVWINPCFELQYFLSSDFEPPTEAEFKAFAEATATFNAWPFLREFVQSMLARMNLPRITVPLLRRLPVPDKDEGDIPDSDSSKE